MKTGTTFIQSLLSANKQRLAEAGYLFPGTRWLQQDRAVRDVLDFADNDPQMYARSVGKWAKLSEEMLRYDGKASIFSMEFLSFADHRHAQRVVGSLPGATVHVILIVRDAAAALPAQWQTSCRNGGTVTWPRFVRSIRRSLKLKGPAQGPSARLFQRTQGIPRMLKVWARVVPPERIHVITVPPRGSDPMLLWQRFASVVGVDPATCAESPGLVNPSLGYPSTELLRRVNKQLGDVPPQAYRTTVKGPLARQILGERAALERPATLDVKGRRLATAWNHRMRVAIQRRGVHLVGSLDELPVGPPDPATAPSISTPSGQEILEAAATARDGLLRLVQKRSDRGPDDRPRALDEDGWELPTTADRWASAPDPEDAAVVELTGLVRTAMGLEADRVRRARSRPQAGDLL
jgi:hypothetical protein